MEEKIINFFRRAVFGTNYSIKNKNDLKMICNCCFSNAWKDMARTLPIKDKSLRQTLKENMFNDLYSQVQRHEYKPREIISKYCQNAMTLGQSQKVINMFFKYLYTFSDTPFINKKEFINCDCPIDSIIINKISSKQRKYKDLIFSQKNKFIYKDKTYVWSKIDNYDAYLQIQELISHISNNSNLDFDFNEWE
ncbi:MAG: hypothetical protein ACLRFL_00660 [Clostridia bacterium]